jgi:hypothetical protein
MSTATSEYRDRNDAGREEHIGDETLVSYTEWLQSLSRCSPALLLHPMPPLLKRQNAFYHRPGGDEWSH